MELNCLPNFNLLIFKGTLRGTVTLGDAMLELVLDISGTPIWFMIFAVMIIASGIFADPWKSYILKVAAYGSNGCGGDILPGYFCNWLVIILAIWSAFRCTSDSGKLIMIW